MCTTRSGGVGTTSLQVHVGGNLPGDFDGNGQLDALDVDALSAAIVSGSQILLYDVTGDGVLNVLDLEHWVLNLKRTLLGDANLDFVVDGSDFIIWNNHKFTFTTGWTQGDFNADGVVDGIDFFTWNANKFATPNRPSDSRLLGAADTLVGPVPVRQLASHVIDLVWTQEGENRSMSSRFEWKGSGPMQRLHPQTTREFPTNRRMLLGSVVFAEWGLPRVLSRHSAIRVTGEK